ncbi:uncharacterized protein LOC125653907 isoform X1 [Ostrea edulis]|uniref:uncharacterized protein LOC125653907 isoform X1 n=2 Tax=Ostrea edulis TaxID=37623 RepID=UPI0024AF5376|nr:uncharacterized protein LOC125653907 isoform X1 [Ostrea edulis]
MANWMCWLVFAAIFCSSMGYRKAGEYVKYGREMFWEKGICKNYPHRFKAHPKYCHAYYDCTSASAPGYRSWDKGFRECVYPKLFNAKTRKCEMFFYVKCGTRKEFKSGCDYFANQCLRAHCIPCSVRIPSCAGFKDGIHEHPYRKGSRWLMNCLKERLMNFWYGRK